MNFEIVAYRIPSFEDGIPYQQMAQVDFREHAGIGDTPARMSSVHLRPVWGHAASYYRVDFDWGDDTPEGWRLFQMTFIWDAIPIGTSVPGAVYIKEPTDMPTALMRCTEQFGPDLPKTAPPSDAQRYPAGVWLLTIRRSA